MPGFWIGVAHARQVALIRAQGLVAFSKGQKAPLARMSVGDRVVYYAPRDDFDGAPVQAFVALATVTGEPFETVLMEDKTAWVCAAEFAETSEVPIRPMIPDLTFITKPTHWGMAFRRSHFAIPEQDFNRIAGAMSA